MRLFSEGAGGQGEHRAVDGTGRCGAVYDGGDQTGAGESASERDLQPRGFLHLCSFHSPASLPVSLVAEERNGEKRTRFGEWRTRDGFAVMSRFLEKNCQVTLSTSRYEKSGIVWFLFL